MREARNEDKDLALKLRLISVRSCTRLICNRLLCFRRDTKTLNTLQSKYAERLKRTCCGNHYGANCKKNTEKKSTAVRSFLQSPQLKELKAISSVHRFCKSIVMVNSYNCELTGKQKSTKTKSNKTELSTIRAIFISLYAYGPDFEIYYVKNYYCLSVSLSFQSRYKPLILSATYYYGECCRR